MTGRHAILFSALLLFTPPGLADELIMKNGSRLVSDILPDTQLYLNADGVVNFDHLDRQLVNTTIGIRLPVIYGLTAGAEVKYEYDGGAVEGVDDLDETYNGRFGYAW